MKTLFNKTILLTLLVTAAVSNAQASDLIDIRERAESAGITAGRAFAERATLGDEDLFAAAARLGEDAAAFRRHTTSPSETHTTIGYLGSCLFGTYAVQCVGESIGYKYDKNGFAIVE